MALNYKKSITITGESKIGDKVAIYLNANITTDTAGNSNVTTSIQDQTLYRANKTECRQDIDDFQEKVWAAEDDFLAELEGQA